MIYENYNVPRGTIEKYIELLSHWNKKINLVSIKNTQELIDRHIIDCLQLINHIEKTQVVFDIGSGAGFPGLMLSYAGIEEVNLIEKINKKVNFLRVAATLSTNKVNIHNQKVENIHSEKCDIITARGFSSLEEIFELTSGIKKSHTKYILQKGKNLNQEIKNALEKWNFEYIIHPSITSNDGYILEVVKLRANAQAN